ncbi:MAG: hypothetical protein M9899_09670 [Bdellovibrionaceae bacterium]|nr:hypothetical protein [Pseudobdellovibrionaceae bacterium]
MKNQIPLFFAFAIPLFLHLQNLQAAVTPLSQNEVLTITGLDLASVVQETEASLESYLFQDAHGMTCGLKHFYLEGFETTDNLLTHALKNFSVITKVYGPIYPCKGYEYYLCSTEWTLWAGKWSVIETLCED